MRTVPGSCAAAAELQQLAHHLQSVPGARAVTGPPHLREDRLAPGGDGPKPQHRQTFRRPFRRTPENLSSSRIPRPRRGLRPPAPSSPADAARNAPTRGKARIMSPAKSRRILAIAACMAFGLSGCGFHGLNSLPLPGVVGRGSDARALPRRGRQCRVRWSRIRR